MAKGFLSGLFGKKKAEEPASTQETTAPDDVSPDDVSVDEVLVDETLVDEDSDDDGAVTDDQTSGDDLADNALAAKPLADDTNADERYTDDDSTHVAPADEVPNIDLDIDKQNPVSEPQQSLAGPEKKKGFFSRLKQGLSKTSGRLTEGVTAIFTKKKLDEEMLEELENLLISADLGLPAATRLTTNLAASKFDKEITDLEVREALAEEVASTLRPLAQPLTIDASHKPHVILMTGVNGAGKTTTIGKLASTFKAQGKSVMLAAGDTFRAAAIEQLTVWGERTNTPVIARTVGADAAGLAFDALTEARAQNIDVLMIDTAGRLQNRTELMDELAKIVRVIRKLDENAPHDTVLVLDATVGQNALSQVEAFKQTADVTGLVMTKLDGTARGGVLVALADKFALPVHYIGVGEGIDDLQIFDADSFANALADVGEHKG